MAGRRVANSSSERNAALIILGIGIAAALASLFGSIWIVRAGVLVAIVMAAIALQVAFRQVKQIREEHAAQLRREVELRTSAAEKHHADSVAMIERFDARAHQQNGVIEKLRSQLGAAQAELSSMRGNAVWLRAEVAERQARIEALIQRIQELEAGQPGNVVELPERELIGPSVEDIWGEDEHPTMVDLRMLHLDEIDQPERKQA